MCKMKGAQRNAVVQVYRVECNRGSKYFSDEEKASAYFDYMTACGFEAELWLVRRYYDEQGTLVKGEQDIRCAKRASTGNQFQFWEI